MWLFCHLPFAICHLLMAPKHHATGNFPAFQHRASVHFFPGATPTGEQAVHKRSRLNPQTPALSEPESDLQTSRLVTETGQFHCREPRWCVFVTNERLDSTEASAVL